MVSPKANNGNGNGAAGAKKPTTLDARFTAGQTYRPLPLYTSASPVTAVVSLLGVWKMRAIYYGKLSYLRIWCQALLHADAEPQGDGAHERGAGEHHRAVRRHHGQAHGAGQEDVRGESHISFFGRDGRETTELRAFLGSWVP